MINMLTAWHTLDKELLFHIKEAPVEDGIINRHLKELPKKICEYITNIANSIYSLQNFPGVRNNVNAILIQKAGKHPFFPQNHLIAKLVLDRSSGHQSFFHL